MRSQSLIVSTGILYLPSFPQDAFPKGLVLIKVVIPKRKFPQGGAKAIDAQCFTELPWLRPLSLLL
jgi:hypothetical protein